MQITIDVSSLLTPQTGIGRYAEQLVRALLARREAEFRLVYAARPGAGVNGRAIAETFEPLGARVRLQPIPNRVLHASWELLGFPAIEHLVGACEVFHATNHLAPTSRRAAVVATIHDLSALRFPGWHAPYQQLVARYLPKSVRRSERLIADSRATADDLMALLDVPAAKIRVVPLAAAAHFHAPIDRDTQIAVRSRYALDRRYFLFVGTMEPRKNVGTLLLAYQKLPEATQREVELVLVGSRGWEDERLFSTIAALPTVRWLGRVPDDDLPALMAGSAGFVYPSRFEGFGLPVLEAMAAGAPVITSPGSSLGEVAGDAAWMVEPDDVRGLTAALAQLAGDASLADDLRGRGRARAAGFSWDQTARETMAVYREAVGAAGR